MDDYLNGVRTPKPPTELLYSGDRWTETVVRKRMRTITKLFEGLRSINQIACILIADVPHKTNWTCMAHVPQGVASLGGLEDLVRGSSDINRGHKRKLKKERSSTKCLEANRTSRLLSRPSDNKVSRVDRYEFVLAINCTFVLGRFEERDLQIELQRMEEAFKIGGNYCIQSCIAFRLPFPPNLVL